MSDPTQHERQASFDWQVLDPDTRATVRATTDRLHELERRTSEGIIEMGRQLLAVKTQLPHGQFLPWLDAEFGWSYSTAARFMKVAEKFNKISHVENFQMSALYTLAADSIPDAVFDEFSAVAEAGGLVTLQDVRERIAAENRPASGTPGRGKGRAPTSQLVRAESYRIEAEPKAVHVVTRPTELEQKTVHMTRSPQPRPVLTIVQGAIQNPHPETVDAEALMLTLATLATLLPPEADLDAVVEDLANHIIATGDPADAWVILDPVRTLVVRLSQELSIA